MKNNIYSFLLFGICLIVGLNSYAQKLQINDSNYQSRRTHINPEFCGTDQIHEEKMLSDEAYRVRHLEMIERLRESELQRNPVNGVYQVPVVVHVMHKGEPVGTGTNISDSQVKAGIEYLNNFWRKVAGSNGDGNGVDMKIEFTLAIQDEFGNCTDGIDRVDMSGVPQYVANGVKRYTSGIDDWNGDAPVNSLKEYSIWDPTEFYNVWIIDEIDNTNCYSGGSYIAGYAYYASQHGQPYDGSVVLICTYLDESSDTWAHEMGHALNLPHTFDGDNGGSTCGDDGINDTPSHVRTSSITPSIYFDCTNTDTNGCDASFDEEINPETGFRRNTGTHQDHMHNYMDYTGCADEFTGGQRSESQLALTVQRASFISGYALTPPLPATVDFSSGVSAVCLGSSVTFRDESTCTPNTYTNTGYSGISFSWTFDNGLDTPYTSSDQNPTITFSNSGTYNVTLEITNPQGTTNLIKTGYISVTGSPAALCEPTTSNTGNFNLAVTNVQFNTIDNFTGNSNIAYTNYACTNNTVIDSGNAYNLSVDIIGGAGYTEYAEVWIDWDNSGTFETSNANSINELVLSGSTPNGTSNTLTTSITSPVSAPLNTLLTMRVIGEANSVPDLCLNNFVGDCEDYGVYVRQAPVTYSYNNSWSPGNPSGSASINDEVIITAGNASISSDTQCNTVAVDPGAGLTVDTGVTLTANTVTLNSTSSSFSSLILDGAIVGTVNYERWVNSNANPNPNNNGRDLISPPLDGLQFNVFYTANTANLVPVSSNYLFGPFNNSTGAYVEYPSSETATLDPGKGYRAATSDAGSGATLKFTGTVKTGPVDVAISDYGDTNYGRWNLIGNPYPSYISFKDFYDLIIDVDNSNVNNQLDPSYSGIYGYDSNAGDGSIWTIWDLNNTNYTTDLIAPGQGFFVKSKSGGGTATFTSSMRQSGGSNDFITNRLTNVNVALAKLKLINGTYSFYTNLYFRDGNTLGLDPGYDTGAYGGAANGIFTHLVADNSGIEMANQSVPFNAMDDVVVPLGVHASLGEQISIGLDTASTLPGNINVHLEDNVANIWTLLNSGDYNFTPDVELTGTGRFSLHFTSSTLSAGDYSLNGINIFSDYSSRSVIVKGQLVNDIIANIYDMMGRVVVNKELSRSTTTNTIAVSTLSAGIYFVELQNGNQHLVQKVIIR